LVGDYPPPPSSFPLHSCSCSCSSSPSPFPWWWYCQSFLACKYLSWSFPSSPFIYSIHGPSIVNSHIRPITIFFCLGFSILQSVNLWILKGKEKLNIFKWILYKFGLLWRRSTDREQGNEKWPMEVKDERIGGGNWVDGIGWNGDIA
jgi:hypothetical protein